MDIEPLDIVIHIVNIIVLFVILRALLYKPIRKYMAERTARVNGGLADAERLRQEAEDLKAEYDGLISSSENTARDNAMEIIRHANADASAIIDTAEQKALSITDDAKKKAQSERDAMLEDMRGEIGDISVEIASRILAREVSKDDNAAIIEGFFKR